MQPGHRTGWNSDPSAALGTWSALSYSGAVQYLAHRLRSPGQTGYVTPANLAAGTLLGPGPSSPTQRPAALKAYIVEDNAVIRGNLVETLTELAGVQTVGYAETEQSACTWLAQHPRDWQLLVVDLFLQQGSGLGVLKGCRQRSLQQRVVVLSNYATEDIRRRCLAGGADAVFDKSTELDQFLAYCTRPH